MTPTPKTLRERVKEWADYGDFSELYVAADAWEAEREQRRKEIAYEGRENVYLRELLAELLASSERARQRAESVHRLAAKFVASMLPFGTDDEGIVFIGDNLLLDKLRSALAPDDSKDAEP